MNIKIAKTNIEIEDAFFVRNIVFVDEQKVSPEEELDQFDNDAIHFIGYQDQKRIAASRLRWIDGFGKLERICVLKDHRNQSYGKQMIKTMEEFTLKHGLFKTKLNAQTQAESFYKKLGYTTNSGVFLDAGMPHITMIKQFDQ